MVTVPDDEQEFFAAKSSEVIEQLLASKGVEESEYSLDDDVLLEIAAFFLRDIYRIDQQQRGTVSIAKWAGYWAFWIRKLKPISMTEIEQYSHITVEDAVNINELIAVQFALEIVGSYRADAKFEDRVMLACSKAQERQCNGVDCFWKHAEKYLNFGDEFFLKYILYSMRNRTFGPHHFALLIENIIFASCDGIED
jgi:hypothetical protein